MGKPRVSVLLPVFDAAEFLPACLKSIDRQSLDGFEVVAIDDGSTDGSSEILETWGKGNPRVNVLKQPHRGLVEGLNTGLEACKGDLVARIDADDIVHPHRFLLQAEFLQTRPDVSVVSSLVRHFPHKYVAEGFRLYDDWLNSLLSHERMAVERFVEAPIAHPSVMFRKETVSSIGGYRDTDWPEDYDLWLRLFEKGKRFAKINRFLLFWRDTADRLSRTDSRYSPDAFLRCKAHYFARGPASSGVDVVLWGAGPNGKRMLRYLKKEGVTIRALIDIDRAKIGRRIGGLEVFGPEFLPDLMNTNTIVAAAVASRGARRLIQQRLTALGLLEGRQFWCLL